MFGYLKKGLRIKYSWNELLCERWGIMRLSWRVGSLIFVVSYGRLCHVFLTKKAARMISSGELNLQIELSECPLTDYVA